VNLLSLTRSRVVAGLAATVVVAGSGIAVAAARVTHAQPLAPMVRVPASAVDFDPPSGMSQLLRQPDGTTFAARLSPASTGGLFETGPGYSVARDASGTWRFVLGRDKAGHLLLSKAAVGEGAIPAGLSVWAGRVHTVVNPRTAAIRASIQQQLASAAQQAAAVAAGQQKQVRVFHVPALMLATWWDTSKGQTSPQFQAGDNPAFYQEMLSSFGGNPRGSITQFYYQSSFGQFLVKIDVYGPYVSERSRQDRCYYGGIGDSAGSTTDPIGSELGVGGGGAIGMATEAVPQANKDIGAGWGKYDNDGDGRVDFTILIHSGADMAVTGDPCNTWSHAIQMTLGEGESIENTLGLPNGTFSRSGYPTSTPGEFIDRVVTIPEFESSTDPLTIAVGAHEMGHALGEPDYYDVNYTSNGVGDYDIMAGGSYLGDPIGSNPALFDPASRVFQGWVTPLIVHHSLRHWVLKPRTVVPFKNYHIGEADPNLLLVPTYEIAVGQTDNLGHTWGADDVYGLARDNKTKKYVVEGYYVENVDRQAHDKPQHKGDAMGAMFDRMQHGSGLLVWHFDYWRQSTTYFAHANDAQNDPNRYQLDVEEFDQNDNTQELQLNYSRGNASDFLVGAATGITSGTRQLPPHIPKSTGAPQKPIDITGVSAGTAGTADFTVANNPNNYTMTVTVASDNPAGDCQLSLTDPKGKTTPVSDSGGAGAPETINVKKPIPGKWTATVGDFAGCGQWSGRVIFAGPGGFLTSGSADTWSNWSQKPTGWAFTNVSGYGNGLDESDESGKRNGTISLDVLNLNGRKDVSPGFVTGALNASAGVAPINVGANNQLRVPIFSNGSKRVGAVQVVVHIGSAHGRAVANKTVRLNGYQRKDLHFTYRPLHEGEFKLVTVVDPHNRIKEAEEHNQAQATTLWAGPRSPKVLIVDDDETLMHERAIAGALASLGVPYAIATAHPTLKLMKHYRAVIWETAVDRYEGQLDKYDRAALTAYLNGGGKLLVSSNRIMDAVGVVGSPQSTDNNVKFGAEYLGERQPDGNTTYIVGMERFGTVTGQGLLAGSKLRVEPSAGRKFVGVAGLAQAGTGGLGTTIKPFGAATGIATLDKASMAGVQPAKDTPYIGIAVDGDSAHHNFKTVTLGWNIGDDTNAGDTVKLLQPILRHFGVPLHRYTVRSSQPVIYAATVRDQISGVRTPITAVVLGGHGAVKLHFRRHNKGGFYVVRMRKAGPRGTYVGAIPGKAVTPDGVDYFITAGRTSDPGGASTGLVFHGIGVAIPIVKHPLVPRGA
jgi:M6 family metalloprotease-like protein